MVKPKMRNDSILTEDANKDKVGRNAPRPTNNNKSENESNSSTVEKIAKQIKARHKSAFDRLADL